MVLYYVTVALSTILKSDTETNDDDLDRVFHALGNRTRRRMLSQLACEPATIGELAAPFEMSLPGASKHLRVLEDAGLVTRHIDGRQHRCCFTVEPLAEAQAWLDSNTQFWDQKLDQLAEHFSRDGDR
jgi:DNA-binding transcriptional ArsR family regulator